MNIDKRILLYDCLAEFKKQFYKNLLNVEHVTTPRINVKSLTYTDGFMDKEANFWGWTLEKGADKYLLPDVMGSERFNIADVLPIAPQAYKTVSFKGIAYKLITQWAPARFKSEKTMSFKELVNILTSFEHSNKDHQRMLWLLALSQMLSRTNYRVATQPSFGKDSAVETIGALFGKAAIVETPTLAKLEYLTYNKLLCISEIVELPKDKWDAIQQFLLAAGALKSDLTKHSRAYGGGGENYDISGLSISIIYNDLTDYPGDIEDYVDFRTKRAVLDRFPAFRFHGQLTEDFNSLPHTDVQSFVEANIENYKKLIYAFTYYKNNVKEEGKEWERQETAFGGRWDTTLTRVLDVVSMYAETQEEFTFIEKQLLNAMKDYGDMIEFGKLMKRSDDKINDKERGELENNVKKQKLFKDKIAVLKSHLKGETNYAEAHNHNFWSK